MEHEEKAAKWAQEKANGLPEKYQVAGFQEFLRHRLADLRNHDAAFQTSPTRKKQESKATSAAIEWLESISRDIPEDHVIRENGTTDHKVAWAVIGLVSSGEGAVNSSVGNFIRVNLGIAPPVRQNINRSFKNLVPKYLSREQQGRGFVYSPKPTIAELFSDLKSNEA